MRRHFHQFIVLDILQSLLEGELDGGRQDHFLVTSGSADVGELLGLADVDVQVALAGVLSEHLAAVDLLAGFDEETAAVEQLVHGVSDGLAGLK